MTVGGVYESEVSLDIYVFVIIIMFVVIMKMQHTSNGVERFTKRTRWFSLRRFKVS